MTELLWLPLARAFRKVLVVVEAALAQFARVPTPAAIFPARGDILVNAIIVDLLNNRRVDRIARLQIQARRVSLAVWLVDTRRDARFVAATGKEREDQRKRGREQPSVSSSPCGAGGNKK